MFAGRLNSGLPLIQYGIVDRVGPPLQEQCTESSPTIPPASTSHGRIVRFSPIDLVETVDGIGAVGLEARIARRAQAGGRVLQRLRPVELGQDADDRRRIGLFVKWRHVVSPFASLSW